MLNGVNNRRLQNLPQFLPWLDANTRFQFPDPRLAMNQGLLCTGGNLSPGMLLSAYSQGIFPWFHELSPISWFSPNPRFVLYPESLHVSRSTIKYARAIFKEPETFGITLTLDHAFRDVMSGCAKTPTRLKNTWITDDMIDAYCQLHKLGYAHSVETWKNDKLVGGLYGVALGSIFFGESMFSLIPNASKYACIALTWRLIDEGFSIIDSQVYTDYLDSMGATLISREEYLRDLEKALQHDTKKGNWNMMFEGFPLSSAFCTTILEVPYRAQ